MHIDARELENNYTINGDICIIGAGVAGISLALQLMNTSLKVVLLEGGGFEYDNKIQKLYDGNIIGQNYYPMMSSRLHYFGGTSGHWGGMCSKLDEIDFQKRSWIRNSGWPITLKDLEIYYKKASELLDLQSDNFNIKYWQQFDPLCIPLPLDKNVIWSKIWQQSKPTRFGEKYKEMITNAPNIDLYTYLNVTNIQCDELINNITEVSAKNYTGKKTVVKAKHFILACSALQNARLLLASNSQFPAGLGNYYDNVGRYFMEHPEINTGELWLNTANPLHFYKWNKYNIKAELAVSAEKQEELKILNGTISLMPLERAQKMLPSVLTWSKKDPIRSKESFIQYASYKRKRNIFNKLFPRTSFQAFGMHCRMEQSPNPDSRITLNNDTDSLGMPRTDLNWALSPIDKRSMRELNKLIGIQLGLKEIGRVKIHDFLLNEEDDTMPNTTSGGWHHIGTTRMSNDPKKGVVDSNCKVHGINNLFVAGSSCFPTAGAVNPTLSIVAISLRLGEHLKEIMRTISPVQ